MKKYCVNIKSIYYIFGDDNPYLKSWAGVNVYNRYNRIHRQMNIL